MTSLAPGIVSAGFFSLSNPGPMEILIVLAIILVVFGPKRLPALSRAIGKSIRDFKKGLQDVKDDIESADVDDEDDGEKKGGGSKDTQVEDAKPTTYSAPAQGEDSQKRPDA